MVSFNVSTAKTKLDSCKSASLKYTNSAPNDLILFQIHEKTWISRTNTEKEEVEYRDIRVDYPGVDDFIHQEELGYRKGN